MDVRYGFSFFVLLSFIWEGVYVFLRPSLLRRDFIDKVFRVVALEEGLVEVVSFILLGLLGVAVCFGTVE